MKEIHWKLYNSVWLAIFVILVSWDMGIPIIGVAFLPLFFIFVWLFSTTIEKFGNSWIVWMIPYAFSSIFYLWFFVGGNPLLFVFSKFWLSLSHWFTPPLSPFGMAVLLIAISYVVSYFIAHNLKHTMNASLPLVVTSAIAGIASQYDQPLAAFGFTILLIGALILNSKYNKKKMSRMVIIFITTTILIAALLFSAGTLFKPFTPLGDLFTFKSLTSPSTVVSSHRIKIGGVPTNTGHTYAHAISISEVPDWLYEIIVDVFGVIVAIIGVTILIGRFFTKEKVYKKSELKTIIFVVWAAFSTVFLLFLVMYLSKIVNHRSFQHGTNFSQQLAHPLHIAHESTQTVASTVGFNLHIKNPISLLLNPIVLSTLVVMGAVIVVYMIFEVVKRAGSGGYEEEKTGANEHVSAYESENMDYSGNPRETVLFYYGVLRDRIGDPSMTPHEFGEWLEKEVGKEKSGTLTRIFVKLRYAHRKISQKEAEFVKKFVKGILSGR